jgi:hypothetical protein
MKNHWQGVLLARVAHNAFVNQRRLKGNLHSPDEGNERGAALLAKSRSFICSRSLANTVVPAWGHHLWVSSSISPLPEIEVFRML